MCLIYEILASKFLIKFPPMVLILISIPPFKKDTHKLAAIFDTTATIYGNIYLYERPSTESPVQLSLGF